MTSTYNGLPLYEANIDMQDEETGVFCISLVDLPATQSDFLAFGEDKQILTYAVQDEEQRKVFGLVMGCDMPIYRVNNGYEYFITYSKETIAKMAEKYMAQGYQNNVDTMHNFKLEEGIVLTQSFIKDSEKGVSPKGFEDYNDGSWFAEFHILNDEVWTAIKDGTYKGFSLAGCFIVDEIPVEEKHNKIEKNTFKMKIEKVKSMLRKMLAEFGEISTDKGVLIWDGDEDIKVGDAVHSIDEEGNDVKVEDGDYTTEDKRVITIADGKVAEIKDVEEEKPIEEEKPTEEEEEKPIETEEEKPIETEEEKPAEEEEKPAEEEDEKDLKIKELEEAIAEKDAKIAELEAKIAELEKEPAAPSAEEAFASKEEVNTKASQYKKRGYRF